MAEPQKKRGRKPILTVETVEPTIERFLGNLAVMAASLRVSRQAMSMFIKKNPRLGDLIEAEKDRVIDLVEHSLHKKAIDGESWAVCFFLKTQARNRGYCEKLEQMPPLDLLIAALPENVRKVVQDAIIAAVQPK